jgi:aromatic ring-opening dioxygenase catalytic subunit (LigB family)
MNAPPMPVWFIPHGGGPCFFLDPGEVLPAGTWDAMGACLRGIGQRAERPRAILVVSAHWAGRVPARYAPPRPSLLFDYYGFPEKTYRLQYPAAGATGVAGVAELLLAAAGIHCAREQSRGFDHGVFVPLLLMYPDADIPVAQLSLMTGYDAAAHIAMGRALAPLREQGVLIEAGGLSFHNLRGLMHPAMDAPAKAFHDWP